MAILVSRRIARIGPCLSIALVLFISTAMWPNKTSRHQALHRQPHLAARVDAGRTGGQPGIEIPGLLSLKNKARFPLYLDSPSPPAVPQISSDFLCDLEEDWDFSSAAKHVRGPAERMMSPALAYRERSSHRKDDNPEFYIRYHALRC